MRWLAFLPMLLSILSAMAQNGHLDVHLRDDAEFIELIGSDYPHLFCVEGSYKDSGSSIVIGWCACKVSECGTPERYVVLSDKRRIPFYSTTSIINCSGVVSSGGGFVLTLDKSGSVRDLRRTQ